MVVMVRGSCRFSVSGEYSRLPALLRKASIERYDLVKFEKHKSKRNGLGRARFNSDAQSIRERRIALYRARAKRKLDLFTGLPVESSQERKYREVKIKTERKRSRRSSRRSRTGRAK